MSPNPAHRPTWLLALGLTVAAACSPPAEPVLEPVARLAGEPLGSAGLARCAAGTEIRPAFGCPDRLWLHRSSVKGPAGGDTPVVAGPLPLELEGRPLILEPQLFQEVRLWTRVPPSFLAAAPSWFRIELPWPEDLDRGRAIVRLFARPLPPARESFASFPVAIGEGARLTVGLGFERAASEMGTGTVEFVVEARDGGGRTELLREVVDGAVGADGWQDRTVDLERFAGETLRFRFTSTALPRPVAGDRTPPPVPLWGAPRILEPRPRGRRRNLVLISLDTLRADALDPSAWGRALMPRLQRLAARECAVFEQAVTAYPSTSGAHMTLFTGIYPASHGVVFPSHVLSASTPTLAELLAAGGYTTAAFTEDAMLAAGSGFVRGFDVYRENRTTGIWNVRGQVEETFGAGLEWLEEHREERTFLFLHTYQTHSPYEPPEPFAPALAAGGAAGGGEPATAEERMDRQRQLYAGEVRYVDAVAAGVIEKVWELAEPGSTIVVVTSDHGEEFGEHGGEEHGGTLYDEVLRVPLVVCAPGLVPPGIRIRSQVSLVDLVPTLFELLGLEPPPDLHGESLVPLLTGTGPPPSPVRFAQGPERGGPVEIVAARTESHKWIGSMARGSPPSEIYDLELDPGETVPLDDPELTRQGLELLDRYRELAAGSGTQKLRDLDPDTLEQLRALGYLD